MKYDERFVNFTHNGVKYEKFDKTHPYFVVRDGEVESCHQVYSTAQAIAPYCGGLHGGKKGNSTPIATNEGGLCSLGLKNPLSKAKQYIGVKMGRLEK